MLVLNKRSSFKRIEVGTGEEYGTEGKDKGRL
jgi:hypothetical protein